MSDDGMLPPEAKKMKIASDQNGISGACQQLEKLVINCKDGKIAIVAQDQIDRLLEVDYFNAAYTGHFKENDGQLNESLTTEIAQVCINAIFGKKLFLGHPSIAEVWVTLDRWGVDANEFFEPHPLVEGTNLMENKALSERYQHACHEVFRCDKRGGFTLVGPVSDLFASRDINAPNPEKLLSDLINSNIVPVPIMGKCPSKMRTDEKFPNHCTFFMPHCRRKFNGTVPSCKLLGCHFIGKFNQTITLFATIDIIMKHMGKRYKESKADIYYSMDVDMVSGSTALMTNTTRWDGNNGGDCEEEDEEEDQDNKDDDPRSLGLLHHLGYEKREGYETLQLRHGKFQVLRLIESQMRQQFLKDGDGWLVMARPDSYSLGRFIRAHQLSCSGNGCVSFDPETCRFSIKDNVLQMLKIMVEHLPARNFIGTSGLLLVDFKQLPADMDSDSEEEDQFVGWQLWCLQVGFSSTGRV